MSDKNEATDQIVIHLDADHAIVLFEFLSERAESEETSAATAETAVLDAVLSQLESQLLAPFCGDYDHLLSTARSRLAPSDDI